MLPIHRMPRPMLKKFAIVVLVFGAACGSRQQTPATPARAADPLEALEPVQAPPVYALLGFRERLKLTSPQITAIDSIGQKLARENGSLLEELERAWAESASSRGRGFGARRTPALNDEERAALRKVRENNRLAVQGIQALLDAEQQKITCELFDQDERGMTGRRADPNRTRDRRMDGGRTGVTLGRRTWAWCAPPAAARTPSP